MAHVDRLVKTSIEAGVRQATKNRIIALGIYDASKSIPDRENAAKVLVGEKVPGVATVEDLVKLKQDGSDEQKAKASVALRELTEAHYELLLDNGYEEQVIAGARSVNDLLPNPLKGLGSRIADCAFLAEDGKLDDQGDLLRKLMDRVDRVKHESTAEEFGKKANEVYRNIKSDDRLRPIDDDRVDVAKDVAVEYLEKVIQQSATEGYDYHRAFLEREFPAEEEAQSLARKALNMIEATSVDSHDLSVQSLESWLLMVANDDREKDGKKITSERLQLEIFARLALHNTSLEMRHSCGHIDAKDGSNMQDAAVRLKRSEMLLSKDHLAYLMRDKESPTGIKDFELPVGKAFDLFQLTVCDYQTMLDRMVLFEGGDLSKESINASVPVLHSPYFPDRFGNFFMESDMSLKRRMRKFMAYQVMESGISMAEAKKAVELAEDMMWAAGEVSKTNLAFAAGDKYSELIHFGELLSDDAPKGKNVGARMIRGKIETLIVPWFDFISGGDDPHKPIFHNEKWRESLVYVDIEGKKHPDVLPFDTTGWTERDSGGNERVKTIVYMNAKGKLDWETFHSVIVSQKAQLVKNLLMSGEAVDAKKVGVSMFADINDAFSKIDPYDRKTLRPWVFAIMLMNSTGDSRTTWTKEDVLRMARSATASLAMTEDEKEFLDQMDAAEVAVGRPPVRKRGIDSFLDKDQLVWALKKSRAMSNAVIFSVVNDMLKAVDRVEFIK